MKRIVFVLATLLSVCLVSAQQNYHQKANYDLASRFSPKRLEKMIFSTSVDPHWTKSGNKFWYMYETTAGKKWMVVDPVKMTKTPMFDNDKLAANLTRIVKDPFDGKHLSIENLKFVRDDNWIRFEVKSSLDVEKKDSTKKGNAAKEKKVFYFEYNISADSLVELKDHKKPVAKPSWANVSPDQKWVVYAKSFNLYRMDTANMRKAALNDQDSTIVEEQLTKDGIQYYGYGEGFGESNVEQLANAKKRKYVAVMWSPNSQHFVVTRTDSRKVKDLWVLNSIAEPRPTLESYKYHMPGEKEAPVREMYLFAVADKKMLRIGVEQFKDQEVAVWPADMEKKMRDEEHRPMKWLGDDNRFYFSRTSRDLKKIDVCSYDITSSKVNVLVEERLNTYIEIRKPLFFNNGKEFIHWSEQDGWAHLYHYDADGKLKGQVTSGPWHVEEIEGFDEKTRTVYFTANGKETGEDPYYLHFYKAGLDGSGVKLLNSGDFDHAVVLDDAKKFFINNSSRVNTAPVSALYDANGKKVMDLEKADLSALMQSGYKFPEPFTAKADDGITDLYGVMYKPFDFDSTKKYPIIAYVYPGPQTESVNKAFGRSMDRIDRLAQFGFVVVTLGNRGGHPSRSKWYHNYGYGNLRDYGLADKKTVIEQLGQRHKYVDASRVGIHGHSGGGFMSTAAMLVYPDFFKVAVSSAGNHENNIYNRWWSEKHHGVREQITDKGDTTFLYAIEKNSELAKNLKGRLMLSTGDIDNNVHPGNTIRMANALIKANKRFDLVVLPGQRHGYGDMTEYHFWLMGDYFSKWLLGDFSQSVDIMEMNRDMPQNKK
ncbi:MAG: DPP IV N-terminal domain-containing protein [Chitinophagaceae bacterium]|jgi:dipeptidyl-peptidase-4